MLSAVLRLGARAARFTPVVKSCGKQVQTVRHGGNAAWYYREKNLNVPVRSKYIAEGLMVAMWYWILWHMWYDFGHITGHHAYPDPSKWTDEELGIPPDDED